MFSLTTPMALFFDLPLFLMPGSFIFSILFYPIYPLSLMCFCQCCHLLLLCNNSSRLHPACTLFFTSIVLRMIRFKAAQVYKLIQLYCIYSWLLHLLLSSCSFTWSLFSLEKKNKNSKVLSLKKSCKCSWNDCFCYLTSSVFLFACSVCRFFLWVSVWKDCGCPE